MINLKNKRILITAGPTWVLIDKVRVLSNVATGQTGILLANKFSGLGAKVTLVLGPVSECCLDKDINLIRFKYFDELSRLIRKELKTGRYCAVVHSAAVSDYRPGKFYGAKVRSGLLAWQIVLKPTPKIIDEIKKIAPATFLVGFKFGPELAKPELLKAAKELIARSKADLVVANKIKGASYKAYIVSSGNATGVFSSRSGMVSGLTRAINKALKYS